MAFNKAKALQQADHSVRQGKISQAIKQYLDIVENDPSDLAPLNTVGDLYVREKNVSEALKQFHRLADAYVQEGFNVKAIAIYKKIAKLDPNTVDPLIKLGELYQIQGLGREARDQYVQAAEFYRKKNQNDKAAEVLRKVVQLDPESAQARSRLATFCEQIGRKDEAAQVYMEAAELALHRGDSAPAEAALKKVLELNPKSTAAQLLRARLALARQDLGEVERIIESVPELKKDPAARQLLLEAYLTARKVEEAESLVVEVYRASGGDFAPLASFSALCLEKGQVEAALKPLSEVADELIEKKEAASLTEALRLIWSKAAHHVPTLELLYRVCEKTADEFTIPEVLEALGHSYTQAGDLAKAEQAYQKLVNREPENEHYQGLLKQVLQKQGKEVVHARVAELVRGEVALTADFEPVAAPPAEDAEQANMVKEALDNSDLFTRYSLPEKAVAELEKVLAVYPDQVDIHKRILEICRKGLPERAAQAASALARIFGQCGDEASAKRYREIAGPLAAAAALEEAAPQAEPTAAVPPATKAAPPTPAPSPQPSAAEFDLAAEFGLAAEVAGIPAEAPAPPARQEALAGFDLAATLAAEPTPASPPKEVDLSGEWEASAVPAVEAPPPPPAPAEAPTFNFQESSEEIGFYLENGFEEEARKAVEDLEHRFPGNSQVAELRQRVEAQSRGAAQGAAPAPVEAGPPPPEAAEAPPSLAPPPDEAPEPWELPSTYASHPAVPPPGGETPTPPPVPVEAAPSAPPPPAPAAAPASGGSELLGDLAGELASSLAGTGSAAPPPPQAGAAGAGPASPLDGLLEEIGGAAGEAAPQPEDPETHYNLGVAFREMGLLDEAIGEFQKVVKGARKGKYPPNFLQSCSLLALCFMDKKMPAVAVKWYLRALESPDLDEESILALQYDLGTAYEMAGDTRTALEKFTEVYSQNIDFRDVAEKIRLLQQKVT
jgi:tetratricopeptide (TPR) repeat protein